MKTSLGATLCLLCLSPLASAAPPLSQGYAIDQTRYFASPEIEQVERARHIAEASAFPAVAPKDPQALYDYLNRADQLTAQLLRHAAYLHLSVFCVLVVLVVV